MIRRGAAPAALALWLGVVAAGCGRSGDARLEHARDLTYEKRHADAADEYQALLEERGTREDEEALRQRALALARLGDLYWLELGDAKRAAETYRKLIAVAPASDEAWIARERLADLAQRHLRDLHEAIAQWQALAASGRPGAEKFGYEAAKGYFELHDYEQCRKEARALARNFPEGALADDASFLVATAYQFEGKFREAIEAFGEVRARWPDGELAARATFQIGQCQASLGEHEAALATYIEALKTHPDPLRIQPEVTRMRRLLAETKGSKPGDALAAFGVPGANGQLVRPKSRETLAREKAEAEAAMAAGASGEAPPKPPKKPAAAADTAEPEAEVAPAPAPEPEAAPAPKAPAEKPSPAPADAGGATP